jgi:hypothetical protein
MRDYGKTAHGAKRPFMRKRDLVVDNECCLQNWVALRETSTHRRRNMYKQMQITDTQRSNH